MKSSAKEPMKALTIQQPWATLLSIGAKRIETRSWSTSHRGTIALHASRAYPLELKVFERREEFYAALHRDGKYADPSRDAGHVLAVADLVACVDVQYLIQGRSKYSPWMTEQECAFGNFELGRCGWVLGNVRRLKVPIPCRGARMLWPLPPAVEMAMLEELCA